MANVRVRPYSIYVNGKKFGEMHQARFTLQSGDEPAFGDGGLIGFTDGASTTNLTCQAVQPATKQMSVDLANALLNKQDMDIALPIGPNIYMVSMRCTKAEFDTDQKTGRLDGSFEFGGGESSRS